MKARRLYPWFLVVPTLVLLLVITLYPFIYSIYLSLHFAPFARENLWNYTGAQNFVDLLKDPFFWNSIKVTGIISGAALTLEFLLGMGLALLLSTNIKGKNVFRSIFILPMAFIPVISALTWRLMFFPGGSVVNDLLRYFGLVMSQGELNWFGNSTLARLMLIVIDTWQYTPFVFLILLAGLEGLPLPCYEAAQVDGANVFQRFRCITLPLLSPIIVIVLLLRGMDSIKIFDTVYAVTIGGPGSATETVSFYIYRMGFKNFKLGYASAISIAVFIIVFLVANWSLSKSWSFEK